MTVTAKMVLTNTAGYLVVGYVDTDGVTFVPASVARPLPTAVDSTTVGSVADTAVVDGAGVYWLVRDSGAVPPALVYVNLSTGVIGTPTAPVTPVGGTARQVIGTQYNVTTGGTGYAIGDVLEHIVVLNILTSPATVALSAWVNSTAGTIIAAPAAGNIAEINASVAVSNFPASFGATQSGSWTVGVSGTLPAFATPPAVAQSGSWDIRNITGTAVLPTGASTETTLAALSAKLPAALGAGGGLKVDGSGTALPISAPASLPTYSGLLGDAYLYNASGYTAYATPTDMFTLTAPAGKRLVVRVFSLSCGQTSSAVQTFFVYNRSSANTGGTFTTPTPDKLNSNSSSAQGVLRVYTAAPSALGTAIATVGIFRNSVPVATGAYAGVGLTATGAILAMGAPYTIVVVNPNETLAFNFAGAALPGGFIGQLQLLWSEESV